MEILGDIEQAELLNLKQENAQLVKENNILKTDIGFWKNRHETAVRREEELKKVLQDKEARIKYLNRQLYEKSYHLRLNASQRIGRNGTNTNLFYLRLL